MAPEPREPPKSQRGFVPSKSDLLRAEFWVGVWFIVLVLAGLFLNAVFGGGSAEIPA